MRESREQHNKALLYVKLADALMLTVPFALCWRLYYVNRIVSVFYYKGNALMFLLYFILYILFCRVYDAFDISAYDVMELGCSQILSAFISDGIMYIVIWLLSKELLNVLPLLAAFAGQGLLSFLWASSARKWYFKTFPPKPSAVISGGQSAVEELIVKHGLEKKYAVCLELGADECVCNLDVLRGVEAVFLADTQSNDVNAVIKYCFFNNIEVIMLPDIGELLLSSARPTHMFNRSTLRIKRDTAPEEYVFIKRFFDILISAAAMLILSPVLLITAIAVACDGGPVFYKQTRLTKDGKCFDIIKFRSMRVDAEADGVARLSTGDKDPRITRVGHFIRSCRLDELPQLWNVLVGDMSIVGPRPERPEIAAQYEQVLPDFALRLQVKAGLTGFAQVYGQYNTTPEDKLKFDLMYIAHPSIVEDLKIIFATVKVLFKKESTEGVEEGHVTARE